MKTEDRWLERNDAPICSECPICGEMVTEGDNYVHTNNGIAHRECIDDYNMSEFPEHHYQ